MRGRGAPSTERDQDQRRAIGKPSETLPAGALVAAFDSGVKKIPGPPKTRQDRPEAAGDRHACPPAGYPIRR